MSDTGNSTSTTPGTKRSLSPVHESQPKASAQLSEDKTIDGAAESADADLEAAVNAEEVTKPIIIDWDGSGDPENPKKFVSYMYYLFYSPISAKICFAY